MRATLFRCPIPAALVLLVLTAAAAAAQTRITRAGTRMLRVQAGATAVPLTLDGQNLRGVTSIRVLRNGRPVRGITARIRQARDGRVTIAIAAGADVAPGIYTLELMAGKQRIPVPGSVLSVAVSGATAAVPSPSVDLTITGCSFQQFPQMLLARATIRNGGTEGAVFQTGQLVARVAALGSTFSVYAPGGGLYIAPAGTADVEAQLRPVPAPGSHDATWTADPSDLVAESNARNNSRTCSHAVAPPPPPPPATKADLVIPVMTSNPNSGPPGTTFSFQVIAKNVGTAPVGSSTKGIEVRCTIDGRHFEAEIGYGPSWAWFGAIQPGQTRTYEVRTSASLAPGTKRFECTVDPYNTLPESTENNNARTVLFTVTG